jgi:superfamily I DNA/RNA helicase
MALYRSRMITRQGEKAALMMYGRLLSQYTAQAVKKLGIEGVVHTYFSWWAQFCWEHWDEYPTTKENGGAPDWPAIANLFLERPVEPEALPYLLIDEGQDMSKYFYAFAGQLATHLTVFADENQVLWEAHSRLADIRNALDLDGEYALKQNYRNTKQIAAVAAHFYCGGPTGIPEPPTETGEEVQLWAFANLADEAGLVANLATTHADERVGVLVPRIDDVHDFVAALKEHGVNAQWYTSTPSGPGPKVDFTRPGVIVTTWKSAKGLEFERVVIGQLQSYWLKRDDPGVRMQLYVLASRARYRLIFSYTGTEVPLVARMLPDDVKRMSPDDMEHVS